MKNYLKKIATVIFSAIFVVSACSTSANAANVPARIQPKSDISTIAEYRTLEFYDRSAPELLFVDMDATVLTLVADCEDGQTDDIIFYLWGYDDNTYGETFLFKADGHPETYELYIPAGLYKVCMSGSGDIRKTTGFAFIGTDGSLRKNTNITPASPDSNVITPATPADQSK